MFAVALDPIQQKLGAECPFPAKMVDWAQNKVVNNNISMSIVNTININIHPVARAGQMLGEEQFALSWI